MDWRWIAILILGGALTSSAFYISYQDESYKLLSDRYDSQVKESEAWQKFGISLKDNYLRQLSTLKSAIENAQASCSAEKKINREIANAPITKSASCGFDDLFAKLRGYRTTQTD